MAIYKPQNAQQVENNIKVDVQREAPDSNPYLKTHWLRSLIAGVARRIFDLYRDQDRTETRLFPDTADDETSLRWGNIYVGPKLAATAASGNAIATGTLGSTINIGVSLTAGSNEYITITSDAITLRSLVVSSVERNGNAVNVTTLFDHNLTSFVLVSLFGADQSEYNVADQAIVVTGSNTFSFFIDTTPVTPATGSITVEFETAIVQVESVTVGALTNLTVDTPLTLQQPIAGVDDNLYVDWGEVGGGADAETTTDYIRRYLDKIRNPVAHFNASDIRALAFTVAGVTRVFVEEATTVTGTVDVDSIERFDNVAKVTTLSSHGLDNGNLVTITGAFESEYNVVDTRVLVESPTIFYYLVAGSPTTPATGAITATTAIALGQVRVFFLRDNDATPIPSASEIQQVKDTLDTIRPANTSDLDLIVSAPTAVTIDYDFTALSPDSPSMRESIIANLQQFHEEQTSVGLSVDEDAYRAAIKNTINLANNDTVLDFELSTPLGDIDIASGEIALLGNVTFSL